jgi:hypothetical protein
MDVRRQIHDAIHNGQLRRQVRDAVSEVQAAERERARQYAQLSKLVGPFDCSEMDDTAFAKYGLEKLGHEMPEDEGMAPAALSYVLAEKAKRKDGAGGMDASNIPPSEDSFLGRYLQGEG